MYCIVLPLECLTYSMGLATVYNNHFLGWGNNRAVQSWTYLATYLATYCHISAMAVKYK
jgi:hypothetical protein